jgi:hypothetical protein
MNKRLPLVVAGFFALIVSMSCKKAIEKKAQNMIMDAITNGVWIVEQYYEGSNNISSQFLNYNFQFYENGTVTGSINGTVTSGTWVPNASDYTINSQFPSAGDPIKKLNGLWKIKDSDWDYVKAEMVTANGTNVLYLRKK